MKLITETYMNGLEFLTEDTKGGKKWFIEGRMMQGGRFGVKEDMNGNGRIYEEHILDEAAGKYATYIPSGDAQGELNHPAHPQVNPERVCVVIKQLKKEGLHWNGKAQIVERSPLGQIIIGIMESGGRLGVSTRALGSLKDVGGIKYVKEDLRFTAIDVVKDPSGQGCFVNGIMESVTWDMAEDGRIIQLAVDASTNKITEQKALRAYADLMFEFTNKGK
jgi:hypothetical protein